MVCPSNARWVLAGVALALIAGLSGCSSKQPGGSAPADKPELYLMDAGEPHPVNAEYKRLLEERYGVGFSWGLHHVPPGEIRAHNEKVKKELEKRHGVGVLEKLREEAEANVKARKKG